MVTQSSANIPTAASGTVLQGAGIGTANVFSTATYPSTTTANQLLYSSATNTVSGLASALNSIVLTDGSGVPSLGTSLSNNFTFTSPISGATETLTISNSSNTASSQAQVVLSVAGGSAGDNWVQWTIGTTDSYSLGIDNSAGDVLNFNYAAAATVNPSSGSPILQYDPSGGTFWLANAELFLLQRATVGSFIQLAVTNTDAGNTASSARHAITAQAAAGDPYVLWDITGGTAYEMGVDNSASDVLQIIASASNVAANMSGTVAWEMTPAGEITQPVQPAFMAYLATTANNKTGNGAAYTLGTDALTEIFDQGGDFNTNGTFTAPVTGIYSLTAQVGITGATVASGFSLQIIVAGTSARTYMNAVVRTASPNEQYISLSVLANMTATDTATAVITVTGEAGDTDDIVGAATVVTYFCGKLEC